ncbi:hypothetical protein CEXT_258601 [Caerostris extrusa]|uniref:Uncharacterized protein n=1 Tax=Caerostris extrusa TaxID=172846 RepID=A0AAV4M5R4_CAEEX|nr:hypothetical protein CEXT_258601 [Caerostris extrusa]
MTVIGTDDLNDIPLRQYSMSKFLYVDHEQAMKVIGIDDQNDISFSDSNINLFKYRILNWPSYSLNATIETTLTNVSNSQWVFMADTCDKYKLPRHLTTRTVTL